MLSKGPRSRSCQKAARPINNTTYDQDTNYLRFGVAPFEPERHTAEADAYSTESSSASNRTEDELINDRIDYFLLEAKDHHIQNGDEHKAKLGVSNTMPELKWHSTLLLIQNPLPFDLADDAAKICAHLLHKLQTIKSQYLDKSVYADYQIELRRIRRNSSLCQLFLRVDALQWYNLEEKRGEYIEEKTNYYIEKIEEEDEDDEVSSSSKRHKNDDKDFEDLWSCPEKVQVNGRWRSCRFFVKKSYYIYGDDEFYAVARSNGLPIITVCPIKHRKNEDWVRTPAAWKAVFKVLVYIQKKLELNELPLWQIYANFGKWHSQIRKGYSDGHAHINIVLTSAAIQACQKTCSNLSRLESSTIRPPNYRRNDANTLKEKLKKNKGENLSTADKFGEEATSSNYYKSDC